MLLGTGHRGLCAFLFRPVTRLQALLLVFAFWAAIFLPGLGSTELKGEEGRRILPAVTMLESGNWVVPYVGGEPYFRKPPLVNWMIAASMEVCGVRNEWAARLPSVLCVLALGLVTVGVCAPWLGIRAALAAALFAIANISMIEKGRLAEIEAIYVALSGIGIVIWMAWALRGTEEGNPGPVSLWLLWTVPFVFLGLAALAKGPAHLIFFYAVVLATVRGRREFFSLPHLAGVLLMAGIFACWAVPYFEAARALQGEETTASAAGVWQEQMAERFGGGNFVWRDWLLSLPRGLSNFLPWLLLVPVWWMRPLPGPWFRPLRNVVTAVYVGFLLIPGFLPRYTMPLLVPASVLLAAALREPWELRWWKRKGVPSTGGNAMPQRGWLTDNVGVALAGSSLAAVAIIVFALFVVPHVNRADDIRPLGRAISAAVPQGELLYVFDPSYQPALFYLRAPLVYENEVDRLPESVPWLLCRSKAVDKFRKHWERVEIRGEFKDKQGKGLRLVSLSQRRDRED